MVRMEWSVATTPIKCHRKTLFLGGRGGNEKFTFSSTFSYSTHTHILTSTHWTFHRTYKTPYRECDYMHNMLISTRFDTRNRLDVEPWLKRCINYALLRRAMAAATKRPLNWLDAASHPSVASAMCIQFECVSHSPIEAKDKSSSAPATFSLSSCKFILCRLIATLSSSCYLCTNCAHSVCIGRM